MSSPFASSDAIARAIVAASRIVGADPLEVADKANAGGRNTPISRARYLAFAALRDVLPKCDQWAIARGLGFKSIAAAIGNLSNTRRTSGWWREDWVLRVATAIGATGGAKADLAPEPAAKPSPPRSAPLAAPEPVQAVKEYSNFIPPAPVAASPKKQNQPAPKMDASHWLVDSRRLAVSRTSHGAVHLGEPTAGRSALEMRQRGAQLPGDDDQDPGGWNRRKGVTLAKLKFMEGRER